MEKQYFIYILFNHKHGTLYIGVTNNLFHCVSEHKQKIASSFTRRYAVDKLGYYEPAETMEAAIMREKQLKSGNRARKIALIESFNPEWNDLFVKICEG